MNSLVELLIEGRDLFVTGFLIRCGVSFLGSLSPVRWDWGAGFAFGPFLPLLVGLVGFNFLGSYAGKLLLNRLPERIFRVALKVTLTVLALQPLYSALRAGV